MLAQMMPGMEWIPLIVVLVWGGHSCGAVSIVTSVLLSKSRFALYCGLVAVVVGFLSPPLLWILAGGHLRPSGYLLLASPILPGVVGAGLSQMPKGIWLWLARTGVAILAVLAVVLGGRHWYATSLAAHEMLSLLGGSEAVEIVSVTIGYQGRAVVCDDRSVCRHLARSLRRAKQGRGTEIRLGPAYCLEFQFLSGNKYRVGDACVFDKGFSISVPEGDPPPPEPGWMTHQVNLLEPFPERLQQIWAFLCDKRETAYGWRMIVDERKPIRMQYDERLHVQTCNAR
jgi:hypothetical protein